MDQIIEATDHTGIKARELIAKAKQMIAHHESDTTEIAILSISKSYSSSVSD